MYVGLRPSPHWRECDEVSHVNAEGCVFDAPGDEWARFAPLGASDAAYEAIRCVHAHVDPRGEWCAARGEGDFVAEFVYMSVDARSDAAAYVVGLLRRCVVYTKARAKGFRAVEPREHGVNVVGAIDIHKE